MRSGGMLPGFHQTLRGRLTSKSELRCDNVSLLAQSRRYLPVHMRSGQTSHKQRWLVIFFSLLARSNDFYVSLTAIRALTCFPQLGIEDVRRFALLASSPRHQFGLYVSNCVPCRVDVNRHSIFGKELS
uniref:Uncharacterized protein n=1 Tax=Candidatus Nitrotoga fabula TaxID=2182327 RepID=A0A2X0R7R9_9PROT|nr:protein of unknown function [Candidatus Nitrotoga fabula]